MASNYKNLHYTSLLVNGVFWNTFAPISYANKNTCHFTMMCETKPQEISFFPGTHLSNSALHNKSVGLLSWSLTVPGSYNTVTGKCLTTEPSVEARAYTLH